MECLGLGDTAHEPWAGVPQSGSQGLGGVPRPGAAAGGHRSEHPLLFLFRKVIRMRALFDLNIIICKKKNKKTFILEDKTKSKKWSFRSERDKSACSCLIISFISFCIVPSRNSSQYKLPPWEQLSSQHCLLQSVTNPDDLLKPFMLRHILYSEYLINSKAI